MAGKPLVRSEMRALVDALFVVLVLSLSLISLAPVEGWDGQAPGTFLYRDGTYHVRYSDEKFGTDKPRICLLEGWPVESRVDLVELSDRQCQVDGLNLYRDFESHERLTSEGLVVSYSGSPHLTKSVSVEDGCVTVGYESDQPLDIKLTLWRWYFARVEGEDYRGVQPPLRVEPKRNLRFEFEEGGRTYSGTLEFSDEPSLIEVCRDAEGLNKIVVDYVGSNLSLKISLDSPQPVFNLFDGRLLYPLIGASIALTYLLARNYEVLVKVRPRRTGR